MKALVISHAYVAPINREKIKALARRPDLEISLFLPTVWREGNREYQTDAGEVDGYRIYTGNVLFPGRVTGHVYRDGLIRVLKDFRPDVIHLEQEPWSTSTVRSSCVRS